LEKVNKIIQSIPGGAIEALGIMAGSLLAIFTLLLLSIFLMPKSIKDKELKEKERETLKSLLGLKDQEMEDFEKKRDSNPEYLGKSKKVSKP
jgi:hypothetical protein